MTASDALGRGRLAVPGSFRRPSRGGDNPHPFKHFAARADAVAHGGMIRRAQAPERAKVIVVSSGHNAFNLK